MTRDEALATMDEDEELASMKCFLCHGLKTILSDGKVYVSGGIENIHRYGFPGEDAFFAKAKEQICPHCGGLGVEFFPVLKCDVVFRIENKKT